MIHSRHVRPSTSGGVSRRAIMKALGSIVYAAQLTDGTIKIGWTEHFDERLDYLRQYTGQGVALLAFRRGGLADEQALHASLREHVCRGREYYHPTPEVLAVVNAMRDELHLPHIAA